jgi:hypothetical protein
VAAELKSAKFLNIHVHISEVNYLLEFLDGLEKLVFIWKLPSGFSTRTFNDTGGDDRLKLVLTSRSKSSLTKRRSFFGISSLQMTKMSANIVASCITNIANYKL